MMEKNTSPPSLRDIKGTMETSYACTFLETFKMMNIFQAFPIDKPRWNDYLVNFSLVS